MDSREFFSGLISLFQPPSQVISVEGGREIHLNHQDYQISRAERPCGFRTFYDLSSLIEFAKKIGTKEKSAIFYNEHEVKFIADEDYAERLGTFKLEPSSERMAWSNGGNQITMINLMKCWGDCLLNKDRGQIVADMHNLKLSKNVDLQSMFDPDSITGDFNLIYKDKAGSQSTSFPAEWDLELPLFTGLDPQQITLNLNMKFDSEKGTVIFGFDWYRKDRDIKDALEQIAKKLRIWLPDIKAYFGKP